MKANNFEELVKFRAEERLTKRIQDFKVNCFKAFTILTGHSQAQIVMEAREEKWKGAARRLMAILASEDNRVGWPAVLWEREEAAVRTELLSIMDEMQRAMLAADKKEESEFKREGENEK